MVHPMLAAVEALETALEEAASRSDPAAVGMSALDAADLQDIAQRTWRIVQRVQGSVLLPTVAEADQRRLFTREEYASASSMRDLIAGWLRCPPSAANRLLKTAKQCVNGSFTTTGAALAAGDIDTDHARAVVDAVRRLPPQVLDQAQREQAEGTMLDTARVTDAEVTKAAGHRLLEVVAPDAAAEHADRQAERDRRRAEEARWLEATGFGIAGAKELRLRAESEVIDAFMRLVSSLTPPSPVDQAPTEARVGGPPDDPADADAAAARTPAAVAAGSSPGSAADGSPDLRPIERRRADAAVEVIEACARPDLLDDLTSGNLRNLADLLDGGRTSPAAFLRTGLRAAPPRAAPPREDAHREDAHREDGLRAGDFTADACDPREAWPTITGGAGQADGANQADVADQIIIDACTEEANADALPVNGRTRKGQQRVRGERPSLIVLTNYDHIARQLRAGTASGLGSPPRLVSSSEVERLACEADITPVAMTRNATPVTVASTSRFFRGKQLVALIARDFGCIFPGCSRGLRYSRAHHIIPWAKGGTTSVDNGVTVCSHHHRVIHTPGGWTVRMAEDGLPEFIPPHWVDPSRTPQRHARHRADLPYAA